MDSFEQEERLISTGFQAEQARELVRMMSQRDDHLMTKEDGKRLEESLRQEMILRFNEQNARFEGRFEAIEGRFETLESRLTVTAWKVGAAVAALIIASNQLL
jgi:hypothetical protein